MPDPTKVVYVPNYKVNITVPAGASDEDIDGIISRNKSVIRQASPVYQQQQGNINRNLGEMGTTDQQARQQGITAAATNATVAANQDFNAKSAAIGGRNLGELGNTFSLTQQFDPVTSRTIAQKPALTPENYPSQDLPNRLIGAAVRRFVPGLSTDPVMEAKLRGMSLGQAASASPAGGYGSTMIPGSEQYMQQMPGFAGGLARGAYSASAPTNLALMAVLPFSGMGEILGPIMAGQGALGTASALSDMDTLRNRGLGAYLGQAAVPAAFAGLGAYGMARSFGAGKSAGAPSLTASALSDANTPLPMGLGERPLGYNPGDAAPNGPGPAGNRFGLLDMGNAPPAPDVAPPVDPTIAQRFGQLGLGADPTNPTFAPPPIDPATAGQALQLQQETTAPGMGRYGMKPAELARLTQEMATTLGVTDAPRVQPTIPLDIPAVPMAAQQPQQQGVPQNALPVNPPVSPPNATVLPASGTQTVPVGQQPSQSVASSVPPSATSSQAEAGVVPSQQVTPPTFDAAHIQQVLADVGYTSPDLGLTPLEAQMAAHQILTEEHEQANPTTAGLSSSPARTDTGSSEANAGAQGSATAVAEPILSPAAAKRARTDAGRAQATESAATTVTQAKVAAGGHPSLEERLEGRIVPAHEGPTVASVMQFADKAVGKPGYGTAKGYDEEEQYFVYRDKQGNVVGALKHSPATTLQVGTGPVHYEANLNVAVDPEYRRKGIATHLYEMAKKSGVNVDAITGTQGYTEAGARFNYGRMQKAVAQASHEITITDADQADLDAAYAERRRESAERRAAREAHSKAEREYNGPGWAGKANPNAVTPAQVKARGLNGFTSAHTLYAQAKRANPALTREAFAQSLYEFHKAHEAQFNYEGPTGNASPKQIFTATTDSGKQVRYYGFSEKTTPAKKEPWQMSRAEYRDTHYDPPQALPAQETLPQTGEYNALVADDGSIHFGPEPHVILAEKLGIPLTRLTTGGILQDGVYSDTERDTANIAKAIQTAKYARHSFSIQSHRLAVRSALEAGKPVPAEVLKEHPDLAPEELHAGVSLNAVMRAMGLEEIKDGVAAGKRAAGAINTILNPAGKSDQGGQMARIARANSAEAMRDYERAQAAMRPLNRIFQRFSCQDFIDFATAMETGVAQPYPELQPIANVIRNATDKTRDDVIALGTGALQNYIQDYFTRIWKQKDGSAAPAGSFGQSLEGNKNFLKRRTLPSTKAGMSWRVYDNSGVLSSFHDEESDAIAAAAGMIDAVIKEPLVPVTLNPLELSLMKIWEMQRYIMGQKIFSEMKDSGLAVYAQGLHIPDGYAKINDKIAGVYRPAMAKLVDDQGNTITRPMPQDDAILTRHTQQGDFDMEGHIENDRGRIHAGQWVAPTEAAQVLNNFLSPGLKGNAAYDFLNGVNNALNMAQLGFSAFHLTGTALNVGISKVALAVEQGSRGEVANAAVSATKGLLTVPAVIEALASGSKVLKEYLHPGTVGGDIALLAEAVVQGGGRVTLDRMYRLNAAEGMQQAFREGRYAGAALRLPFAALEATMRPIMHAWVPRIKLGVFADMARAEMARPAWHGATQDEKRKILADAWDSIDNRFGQLVYDNLFWQKTLKDSMQLGVRSMGWTLGTVRELGGAAADIPGTPKRIMQGRGVGHRLAYVFALTVMTVVYGAIYGALHGHKPETLEDYYHPMGSDGQRVALPTYAKDAMSFRKDFWKTIVNKRSPILTEWAESVENKDFYGKHIRNEQAPYIQQALQQAEHTASQFVPFSVREAAQARQKGAPIESQIERMAGFTPIHVGAGK